MDVSCIISCFILTILMMVFMVCQTSTCGPGIGYKTRPSNLFVRSRQPDVAENSKTASGKFGNPLMKNDSRLQRITSTQIVFADNRYESNCRKAIKPCKDSLLRLADAVARHWNKKYKIKVRAAYEESPAQIHSKKSLHLEGRAFDLELIAAPGKRKLVQRSPKLLVLSLPTLAGLAYYDADFTFVEVKKHHIHVSCSKKERKSGSILGRVFSRCFPPDAFVRSEHGKILMKDVKVGDKVLTIDSHGNRIYSDITMMMHRETNVLVVDYVRIFTESGDDVTMSSHHLIPVLQSNTSTRTYIFSKDVQPRSHEILVYNKKTNKLESSRVISIEHVTKTGAYAPLSLEGTLVVNDVMVSCYALFPSHSISHHVFSIWRVIYRYLSPLVAMPTNSEGYHWYPNIFRTVLNMLPVLPYQM